MRIMKIKYLTMKNMSTDDFLEASFSIDNIKINFLMFRLKRDIRQEIRFDLNDGFPIGAIIDE